MEYTKTKELFNRYHSLTIDSLDVLLDYIEEPVLIKVLKELSKQKYEENNDDYNGRNEFDSITRILSFDLSEIVEKFYKLDEEELEYLQNITKEVSKKINEEDEIEGTLKPKLEKFDKDCFNQITELHKKSPGPISDESLEEFFEKYSIVELLAFDKIFENVIDYNMTNSIAIKKIVLERKYIEMKRNYEAIPECYEITVSDIVEKTKSLLNEEQITEDEAYYLSDISQASAMFLECVAENQEENKEYYNPEDVVEVEPTLSYIQELEEMMFQAIEQEKPVQKIKAQ